MMLVLFLDALVTGILWAPTRTFAVFSDASITGAAVVAGVLSIPLGFVIYQLYFVVFQEVDFAFLHRFATPEDRGLRILQDAGPVAVAHVLRGCRTGLDLASNEYRSVDARAYRHAREKNWAAVQWLLATQLESRDDTARREYTNLSDIYHSLGASRFGVIAGTVSYLLYSVYAHHEDAAARPIRAVATLLIVGASAALADRIFTKGRKYAGVSLYRLLTNLIYTHLRSDSTAATEGADRRRHERHLGSAFASAVVRSSGGEHRGWVVDASIGGVAVAVASEEIDEVIDVSINDSCGRPCLEARRVRLVCSYPHAERGRTILRLSFVDESPYDLTEGWIMRALA
jgi:hypothetical protein